MRRLSLAAPLLVLGLAAAGCGQPTVNVVEPFAVVNWIPQDGATCIATTWTLGACMSRKVATTATGQVTLRPLPASGTPGSKVTISVSIDKGDADCISIQPKNLDQGTRYQITLEKGFAAADGTTLGQPLSSTFSTYKQTCP